MRTGWWRAVAATALLGTLGALAACSVSGGRAHGPGGTSTSTTTPSIVAACDALHEPVALSGEVDGPLAGSAVIETALGTGASDATRSSTDLTRWLEREADRDELARFAALLHHVDGQPSWATVAADILDEARSDGVGQVDADQRQVAEATAELARQAARC